MNEGRDEKIAEDAGGAPAAVLSLVLEHKRGHGALYDAVNQGRIGTTRLRRVLAGLPLSRAADRRLMLGDGCEQFAADRFSESSGGDRIHGKPFRPDNEQTYCA